jgi:hypothetical protein
MYTPTKEKKPTKNVYYGFSDFSLNIFFRSGHSVIAAKIVENVAGALTVTTLSPVTTTENVCANLATQVLNVKFKSKPLPVHISVPPANVIKDATMPNVIFATVRAL